MPLLLESLEFEVEVASAGSSYLQDVGIGTIVETEACPLRRSWGIRRRVRYEDRGEYGDVSVTTRPGPGHDIAPPQTRLGSGRLGFPIVGNACEVVEVRSGFPAVFGLGHGLPTNEVFAA